MLIITFGSVQGRHSPHPGIQKCLGEEVTTNTIQSVMAVLCRWTSERLGCWEPCSGCRLHLPFLWHVYTSLPTNLIFSEKRVLNETLLKKSLIKSTLVTNVLMNVLCIVDTKKYWALFQVWHRWKQADTWAGFKVSPPYLLIGLSLTDNSLNPYEAQFLHLQNERNNICLL